MNNVDWQSILMVSLAGVVTTLLTGKFIRRLILLPFEWLSKQSGSKVDDKLVEEARKDLGVDSPTIEEEKK